MPAWHDRFSKRSTFRWAAGLGLAASVALPATPTSAQGELRTSPIAATPPNCAIQLSVANPNPGDQAIPRSLVMSGTALDGSAASGTGISQVQAFLGNRDTGGTPIGVAALAPSPAGPAGAWSLTATIPANFNGGQQVFVYGTSSVSGQQAVVSIPIVVGEELTSGSGPDMAQSFCPSVMAPTAPANPPVATTPQPTAPANPPVATTPQPTASAIPPAATPTPQPVAPPVAAPPPAAVQLSISSPNAPPLTFDTTTLSAPAGAQVTVTYTNNEVGVAHNWHLFNGADSTAPTIAATQIMPGPAAVATVRFTAPTRAGNYFYWCDVHPTIMTGNLVVGGTS